mgnify:CR=1 FL=1
MINYLILKIRKGTKKVKKIILITWCIATYVGSALTILPIAIIVSNPPGAKAIIASTNSIFVIFDAVSYTHLRAHET